MSVCEKHTLCVVEGIYRNDSTAGALCKLFQCSGHEVLEDIRIFVRDYQRDIKNAKSNEERQDASMSFLCLLSGLPMITVEEVHRLLFDVCKEGNLDKKMLYSALIARHELDTLNLFLNYERPYLRDTDSICQGLSAVESNIFMELFLITVSKQQHWLTMLMDQLIYLSKQGNHGEVQNLLTQSAFQSLWPIFFIEALEKQESIDTSCLQVFAEWTAKCEECESSVRELAKKMQWYVTVLLWIQENTLSSQITSEFNVQICSTLTVLSKYCNISELTWDKTHDFLEKQCIDGGFAIKREVALYDAFCACALAFDYILACLHSRQAKLHFTEDPKIKYLQKLEVILCQLKPFTLRLRIMENIFSLLFLRFEDFHEDVCSESEEGEIETNQSLWNDTFPAANLSCTVLSSSMTSVANTVDYSYESKTEKQEGQCNSLCSTNNKNEYEPYHQKHGFVFDRFMTRDLLKVLQSCLDCCNELDHDMGTKEDQNYIFDDMIHERNEEVRNSFVCLKSRIMKAFWKLEMLLGSDFTNQACVINAHPGKISLPPWLFQNCTDNDSASDDELPHATASNRGLRGADVEKSSESGSQSNLTNQSQGLHAKLSRRGRRRSSARIGIRGTKDNIIKRMLSSNQSFVSQCLTRGHLEVAKHVVEALELRESDIAAEVNFTDIYQNIKLKVNACAEERNRQVKNRCQNPTLQAIQRAASAGVLASSLNKEVEKLLSCHSLPSILDVQQISEDYQQLFGGSPELQPIVSAGVDIVLILSSTLPQAAKFWTVVTNFSQELQNTQITVASRSRPIGFLPLLQNILLVPITFVENVSPSELLHRWDIPNFLTRSLRDSLQFWDTIVKNVAEFKAVNRKLHCDITRISSLVPLLQLAPSSVPFRGLEGKQESQYLQDFRSYLKSLSGIANVPLSEEFSTVLSKSPYKLLANVVLDMGTLPQSIEVAASQLGLSLPQILSSELCSSLPSIPSPTPYLQPTSVKDHEGLQVLNVCDINGPARHPVKAVVAILSSVYAELSHQLCVKQKLLMSKEGYLLASEMNTNQFQTILALSWELRDIDLNLLQPGAETLAFYCNLANLMWIHCLVYFSSVDNDFCLKSLTAGCSLQQLAVLNSVAYQVGSAGILTLWEVQRLALGIHLMRPSGTKALKEYAFVTDSFDPLALFVVSTGSIYSPKLKVVYPDNLEEQLQQSVKDFVQYWVSNHSEEVVLPPLVYQYIQSTGQDILVFLKDFIGEIKSVKEYSKESHYFSQNLPVIVLEYGISYSAETNPPDENNLTWKSNSNLCNSVFEYMKIHSPFACLLLQELLKEPSACDAGSGSDEEALEATETSITSSFHSPSFHQYPCLDRLCKRLSISTLCQIFNNNVLLCALHSVVPYELLWEGLNISAEEQDWQTLIDVLNALPEVQLKSDPMLSTMMDLALLELAVECRGTTGQSWLICEKISSPCLRARCVIAESSYWPGDISVTHLKKILQTSELGLYPILFGRAEKLLHSIEVYQKVVDSCLLSPWKSWQDLQHASVRDPSSVLDQILCNESAEICLSWLSLHNLTATHPHLITSKVVVLLLNDTQDRLLDVDRLLQSLPVKTSAGICCDALESLCKLPALQFCVNYLSSTCFEELSVEEKDTLEIVSFGMDMTAAISPEIQLECMALICNPQLMIEQLVMNVQLDAAEQMLESVRPKLLKLKSKSPLSISALDSLLRQYAEKALEFRISQGSAAHQLSETNVLLTSFSSYPDSKEYLMPPVVPSKAEWVPNEQATVCMNCQLTTFTMFNRRHHCRRCGRVVCAQCSPQKIGIEGYGNLKVRVCNSCYSSLNLMESDVAQTSDSVTNANSEGNTSLLPDNVWRLTHSVVLNETVRGEFAYEHAPSVSLCLSILKLHSESAACPNFLVDSCETILSYLQPQGGMPNPEVDYGFVIEMCRSLVIAAKVKCAQWGYVSDEPNCDQRLSKIDLLGILVSNGCEALIPCETTTHGFRRLQTQLLEAELWELALEVSTKAGMERIGVWSAWGKGSLRAGRWKEARDKFTHCFPSSGRINKSAPDSPLLLDILQILESSPLFVDQDVLKKSDAVQSFNGRLVRSPAVAVLNSLASLKSISQGKFSSGQAANGALQPNVYAECCFYLQEYGSHASYLQFLVRHVDFQAAVDHTLSHSVDPQTFFESVYMTCLRRGQIIQLHSAMTAVDSSLAVWTAYIHGICAALERRRLLHTLYEVQQWSKDHVRAAMTCIRFYHLNAKSYSQLSANINHLMRAQSHLEGAHAIACVSKKDLSGQDTLHTKSSSEDFESMWLQLMPKELDHHMSTLERQIELTKFLSSYENEGHTLFEAAKWFPHAYAEPLALGLPTLFGNTADRKLLAGLCLFCGKNVEEGYGIVYRIIESFNLISQEIYEAVAVALYHSGRVRGIAQLLNCIRSSGVPESSIVCDSVLMACVNAAQNQPNGSDIDFLTHHITDQALKIKALTSCGQLKTAYLLAVKHERLDDIEHILFEAERLGQTAIKKICLKRLGR